MGTKTHKQGTSARILQVIEVKQKVGMGTDADPFREIYSYFTIDGKYLAVDDCLYWGEREESEGPNEKKL